MVTPQEVNEEIAKHRSMTLIEASRVIAAEFEATQRHINQVMAGDWQGAFDRVLALLERRPHRPWKANKRRYL